MKQTRNYFGESEIDHSVGKILKRYSQVIPSEIPSKIQNIVIDVSDLTRRFNEIPSDKHISELKNHFISKTSDTDYVKNDIFDSKLKELENHFMLKSSNEDYVNKAMFNSKLKEIDDQHGVLKSDLESNYLEKSEFNKHMLDQTKKIKNMTDILISTTKIMNDARKSINEIIIPNMENLKTNYENEELRKSLKIDAENFFSEEKKAFKNEFEQVAQGFANEKASFKTEFEREKTEYRNEFEQLAKQFVEMVENTMKQGYESKKQLTHTPESINHKPQPVEFSKSILKSETFDMSTAGSESNLITLQAPKKNFDAINPNPQDSSAIQSSIKQTDTDEDNYSKLDEKAQKILEENLKQMNQDHENRMNEKELTDPHLREIRNKQRQKIQLTPEESGYLFRKS